VVVAARYGRLPLRHVENWLHHNVFLGTPLVRRGREAEFWSAALAALDSAPWARGFFHLSFLGEGGPVHRGLIASAGRLGRRCDIVARRERALLASELSPEAYYGKALRTKKRKELRRQKARLGELGDLSFSTLERAEDAEAWCEDFLRLERSGWKGETGSALAADGRTESFFREAFRGGFDAGRLEAIRLRLAWTDSCAREFNAMINAMWTERRSIVRVSVPLAGARRRAVFEAARLAENGAALIGRLRRGAEK
jgi:hypothetical protein